MYSDILQPQNQVDYQSYLRNVQYEFFIRPLKDIEYACRYYIMFFHAVDVVALENM